MDDLEINLARGDRARLLLEDELLNEMLKRIEDDCYREIRSSKLMEGPIREQAYLLLTTIDILRVTLCHGYRQDGRSCPCSQTGKTPESRMIVKLRGKYVR
jgi:hypothetical protein